MESFSQIEESEQIINEIDKIEDHIEQDTRSMIIELNDEIYVFERKIKNNRNKILDLKKKLYQECNHCFVRDPTAAYDDIYKYRCLNCYLYRGEFD